MRRCLLLILTWLVAAQMAWAGAAVCCVSELGQAPASSEESVMVLASEAAHVGETSSHGCAAGHCHCHHAGQATPLAICADAPGDPAAAAHPGAARPLKSHIPEGLERPNWLGA
ncbi:hypothetical protein ACFJGW_17530 [Burkholderiaceae bacterium UC74_6]